MAEIMKLLLNPYVLLALLVSMLGVGAFGHWTGHRHEATACAADKADALARAIDQANAIARQDAEVLTAHEDRRERIRAAFQKIHEGVTRYVENHAGDAGECLSPDGLRLWRAANAGPAAAGAAGEPDYSLPGPAAATLGTRAALAGQPYGSGGALSRVPGTASGLIGLGAK
jgi:hypothetical protein